MLSNRIDLFTILGFRVSVDLSWTVLAVLVTWSLATGYFPEVVEGIRPKAAWWLGVIGALGLFASIILHELAHSVVARRFDIPIRGITLFIFGGVAEMEREPPSAKSEFYMAIVGPIMSHVLAALFYLFAGAVPGELGKALFVYLAVINFILATFNLVPAFPLDGGRVFRAAMWWKAGDFARATRIGAALGRTFGMVLIALGVFSLISGNAIGGMWQALLGFFIITASRSSEMQMVMKTGLEGVRVGQIMLRDVVSIPSDTPLDEAVEAYFYTSHHSAYPVVRGDRVLGTLRSEDIGRVAREDRATTRAVDVVNPQGRVGQVGPDLPVLDAIRMMQKRGSGRLLVVDRTGALVGLLTMRDILDYLSVRQQLDK